MTTAGTASDRPHPVTFSDGAHGFACNYDGAVLALICERAHPPGRPLELSLCIEGIELPLTLRGKSAGSKRRDDQRFDVRLRLHSLRREDRAQLEQLFPRG
jgi:hypothetical protein